MSALSKYLFKEFFRLLGVCLIIFISIYLLIHFFGRVDDFLEAGVSKSIMASYFLYKIPYILVQMLPPSILIAVIILFSIMRKNNEVTALKAAGVNVAQLAQPMLLLSIFLALGLFLISETVVPYTSSKCNDIWRKEVRKHHTHSFYGHNRIWYKSKNAIYWFREYDPKRRLIKGATFYFLTPDFRLKKRIDAASAYWKDGRWHLSDGIIMELKKGKGYETRGFKQMQITLPETPETFSEEERKPEELNYWQLKRFAQRVQEEGYDASKYLVDLNIKLSFPFIVVVMVLIGFPIAMKTEKGGTPVAVSIGVGLCFLYVFILGITRAIGFSGALPPILSAWLANIVFAFFGIYLMSLVPC